MNRVNKLNNNNNYLYKRVQKSLYHKSCSLNLEIKERKEKDVHEKIVWKKKKGEQGKKKNGTCFN